VVELMRDCPGLGVLATSRVPLGAAGETVLPVSGLGVGDEVMVDGASDDAVALFLDRARRVQPALPVTPDNQASARAVCRLADNLPLAIELAAAHAGGLSLPDIEAAMADRLGFLIARGPSGLAQHHSLQACIGWSVQLAGERAQRAFAAVSVFGGRFTLEAAVAVADDDRSVIETMVEHSLLQFTVADGRYLMLDTIRDFAARALASSADTERIYGRLTDWAAGLAATVRVGLDRAHTAALVRVDRDEAGVRAALEHALAGGGRLDQAAEIVVDLAFSWSLRGRCAEGRDWAQRISDAHAEPPCQLAWATAFLTAYAGDLESGIEKAAEAAAQAAEAAEPATQGRALTLVGMTQMFVDPAGAEPVLREAAELADVAGDDWGRIEALQMLAYTHLLRSDLPAALDCADRAMPALARLDHSQLRAWDAAIRADAAEQRGHFSAAESHARAGLALALAVEEPVSAGGALLPLARTLVHLDRADEAIALVAELWPFFDTHPGLGTADVFGLAAAIASGGADPAQGRTGLEEAHAAAVATGLPSIIGETGVLLALARLAAGEAVAAALAAEQAKDIAVGLGNHEIACSARLVGCVAARAAPGAPDAAHAALTDAAALGLRPLIPDGLDVIAGLALDARRPALAARLHAASDRLRAELGIHLSPLARQFRPADQHKVAELLGSTELTTAHAEGARLNLDQAVAHATRTRGRRLRPHAGWDSLTPTERDVIALVTRGLSNQAIGDQLLITAGTVRTHLRSIFGKLAVTSRTELAAQATRRHS
jgi:predicted ATPase/DNA-binding CsgD family transcriptional regulator